LIEQAAPDVVEPRTRHDGDTVPPAVAVVRRGVAAPVELLAEDAGELVVAHLGLLQTGDVGLPLVEPREEPGLARPSRVDVPGGRRHGCSLAHPAAEPHQVPWLDVSCRRARSPISTSCTIRNRLRRTGRWPRRARRE